MLNIKKIVSEQMNKRYYKAALAYDRWVIRGYTIEMIASMFKTTLQDASDLLDEGRKAPFK